MRLCVATLCDGVGHTLNLPVAVVLLGPIRHTELPDTPSAHKARPKKLHDRWEPKKKLSRLEMEKLRFLHKHVYVGRKYVSVHLGA